MMTWGVRDGGPTNSAQGGPEGTHYFPLIHASLPFVEEHPVASRTGAHEAGHCQDEGRAKVHILKDHVSD